MRRIVSFSTALVLLALTLPAGARAQSVDGHILGTVRDSSGAVVPGVAVTLRNTNREEIVQTTISGDDGEYAFRNLQPGIYEVQALKDGFKAYVASNIAVSLSSTARVDVVLEVGGPQERIEVTAGSSMLGTTATQEHGISPETLQQLPIAIGTSGLRAAAAFAVLMPGVSTGGTANAFDARINGGMQSGDEATVDGVSMQQGFMSQSGMVSIFTDFPMSPDMVSEVRVLTSNYAPEYGGTTSGQIQAVTKSGGSDFHGSVFDYHFNDTLNARPWGQADKPTLRKNNYGANIGGPVKLPLLWSTNVKSYFYFDFEGFRQAGGLNRPTLSIPSAAERLGDFRDWRDADGDLIPIYDPSTLRPDGQGGFIKDQFMGCDGHTPNVICPDRINPIVQPWLNALPLPTSSGPKNNYLAPGLPDSLSNADYFMWRYDLQLGTKDHMFASFYRQLVPVIANSQLPPPIASEVFGDPQNSWVNRFNYDRVFTPTLLSHLSIGYLNRNEGYGCVNAPFVDDFPKIAGVAANSIPPQLQFADDFAQLGCNAGTPTGNTTTRPSFIVNEILTWTRSAHTLKVGMEYRKLDGSVHQNGNEAGSFYFGRDATGLIGTNSGSPIASFLLGAVDSASASFRTVSSWYPRQTAWAFHAGDTWRVGRQLTFDYGLRWDYYSPSWEKYDHMSFFDPVGPNAGAGGRAGRLAFAGTSHGAASYGARYPEKNWYGAFAPRLGVVYRLNDRTVLRSGWGLFFQRAFYPGWTGGVDLAGFNSDVSFASGLGGIQPAFYLQDGFPQNFQRPPFIASDYRNGQGLLYRPVDANTLPYAHQWNITLDRQIGRNFSLAVGYVGSAGRRLPSSIHPLNALDPKYLSMGNQLYDEFQPGMTSLHGVPLPYAGWVEQMTGCAPSVAQALRPYPQYCDSLQGVNENNGESLYNSLQIKAERRFSDGIYALVSYTLSRTTSSGSDNVQRDGLTWGGAQGVISPYESGRNKAIAVDDTPHVLSAALVYELPWGRNRKWLTGGGLATVLLGGWQASTVFRYSSGQPLFFRLTGGACNVPGEFRASCIPAVVDRDRVFAQEKGRFDPANGPLLNTDAFEPTDAFNFYWGHGNRIEPDVRGFTYRNQDLSFIKNTALPGGTNLQLSVALFNAWNWHIFTASGAWGSGAFNTDLSSPDFGQWNGSVTDPRTIQVAARFQF